MFIIGINNPNDLVRTSLEEINIYLDKTNETFDETNEEKDISLYSQNDYFHKKPRYIYSIREKELLIDSPPTTVNQQKNAYDFNSWSYDDDEFNIWCYGFFIYFIYTKWAKDI